MTLQKLRRWLGFPLEDRYRVHIEQDIVQSSCAPAFSAHAHPRFSSCDDGALAAAQRWAVRLSPPTRILVAVRNTVFGNAAVLLLIVFLMRRRRPCLDTFFLPLQTFYTAFLCLWGTCVTLLDQFGGATA